MQRERRQRLHIEKSQKMWKAAKEKSEDGDARSSQGTVARGTMIHSLLQKLAHLLQLAIEKSTLQKWVKWANRVCVSPSLVVWKQVALMGCGSPYSSTCSYIKKASRDIH